MGSSALESPAPSVLFVDLDGTVTTTDLLWESIFRLLRERPILLLALPVWLLGGRAKFKDALARHVVPDLSSLPLHEEALAHLRACKRRGTRLVLATASHRVWAEGVAQELDLFDDVLASGPDLNLKGRAKLNAIVQYCKKHGLTDWSYVGDSLADLVIWRESAKVYVVAPSPALRLKLKALGKPTTILDPQPGRLRPLIKALRPHQWVKNSLLFVPLLLAREVGNPAKLLDAGVAFFAFSFCSSSVYVVNDLLDVEADRHHPRKRQRPFASGRLPLWYAPGLALVSLVSGLSLAAYHLPPTYLAVLTLYIIAASLYSAVLKSKLMIDVLTLAGLYALRIFAGGVATALPISEWLLAFSMFLFTSLAFAKRYVEVARLAKEGKTSAKGRDYQVADLSLIESLGASNGTMAVLVFALYINSDTLPKFYVYKGLLWLTCPLMLYWISRLWFLAKREQLNEDPVVFAVTDKVSLSVAALVGMLLFLAGQG